MSSTDPPSDFPPFDFLSLSQVFLSKQQTTDLSGKVQDLLLQKDAIERLGIDNLRAQLARTKAVRQKASTGRLVFPDFVLRFLSLVCRSYHGELHALLLSLVPT